MSWTELWTAARDAAWPGSRSWRLRTTAKLLDSAEPAVANEEQRLTSPRALFVSRSCCNLGHDIVCQLLRLARYAFTTLPSAAHRTAAELLPPWVP